MEFFKKTNIDFMRLKWQAIILSTAINLIGIGSLLFQGLNFGLDFTGGTLIELMLLGLVAYRVGKKLDYDGAAGRVTNSAEGNDLLKRTYRSGWTLDG